jgi:hypothetical protein
MNTRIDVNKHVNSGMARALFALSAETAKQIEPRCRSARPSGRPAQGPDYLDRCVKGRALDAASGPGSVIAVCYRASRGLSCGSGSSASRS